LTQSVADQAFDALPKHRITFDGDMSPGDYAFVPRVDAALGRNFLVAETKISEDLGTRGIGGANFGAPVQHAVGLIEVDGANDVGGNEGIVLARLLDAIDLDGERHRHAIGLQFIGKSDNGGRAPTMSIQNNLGAALPCSG
jgi:hypothetical protein